VGPEHKLYCHLLLTYTAVLGFIYIEMVLACMVLHSKQGQAHVAIIHASKLCTLEDMPSYQYAVVNLGKFFVVIILKIEAKLIFSLPLTFKGDCSLICRNSCICSKRLEGCWLKLYDYILCFGPLAVSYLPKVHRILINFVG